MSSATIFCIIDDRTISEIYQCKALAKVFIRGWLGYFGIASMKTTMQEWDGWLRRRIRMYIWKQWKKPRTRVQNLMKLGVPE